MYFNKQKIKRKVKIPLCKISCKDNDVSISSFPDAPVCKPNQKLEYEVLRHKSVNVSCTVDAQPNNVSFTWKFNNTGTSLEVGEGRSFSRDNVSVLKYTPTAPADYGTLLCWATNVIGRQNEPCVMNVVASSKYVMSNIML